ALAPAPLPANPISEEPATAAANAPTKASIDCCADAVRVRLPAALTLEWRILAWTSPGWFVEMIAGRLIPAVSSWLVPIRFLATEAPIASPAPTGPPRPIATDAPMTVAEIWGSNTVKLPSASFAMIRDIPDLRSVTDHSTPV